MLVMPGRMSPLPAGAPLIFTGVRAALLKSLSNSATGLQVSAEEQRAVLSKRQGSTLSRRSILKSYHAQSGPTALQLPGVPNLRMAKGLPVFTVGSISVQGGHSGCVQCSSFRLSVGTKRPCSQAFQTADFEWACRMLQLHVRWTGLQA